MVMSNDRKAALKELATGIAEATVDAWLDGEIADEQPDADRVEDRPPV